MKKLNIILSTLAIAACGSFVGCVDESQNYGTDGRLFLNTAVNSDVKVVSRATADELNENIIIFISKENKGLVYKFHGINELPAEGITLAGGNYVVEGWAGDSVSASWDARYFKGRVPFTIAGEDVSIDLTCSIANVLAAVKYSDDVDLVLKDYTLTVSHSRGSLTFEGRDERVGSFMMPSTSTDLNWKLEGTDMGGNPYVKEGVIPNVKPATEYDLTVNYINESTEVGGGYLTVEVDERAVVVNSTVTIIAPPHIEGYDFNIDEPQTAEPGKVGRKSLFIAAASELTSVVIEYAELDDILGLDGTDGTDIDLRRMSDDIKAQVEAHGLNYSYEYDTEDEVSTMKINFEEQLMNALPEGEHIFTIRASITDREYVKTSVATWHLALNNDPVSAVQVPETAVWATSATVSGKINKPEATNISVLYRPVTARAEGDWQSAPATVTGTTFTATLTNLTPGTQYEYAASSDGFEPKSTLTFTTEAAAQLPNAGFEDWSTGDKGVIIPVAEGGNLFWDSGNHGSITMKKNVTSSSEEYKHSGKYSAKLESQFVGIGTIGKFAAGNIFVGKYLDTDGTDGILGWGRPFTSRPKTLKGYVKYTPAAIAYTSLPSVNKGDMDNGMIYVALLDNTVKNYGSDEWPIIIKTKESERSLFDRNAKNVIAYGELVLQGATEGEGLIEFDIPLEYVKTDVKVSNIMIVFTASRYGDYFTGGPSVMYIDDLTLEY